jgi:hypothetical protein
MSNRVQHKGSRRAGATALVVGLGLAAALLGLAAVVRAGPGDYVILLPVIAAKEGDDVIRAGDLNNLDEAFAGATVPAGMTHSWTISVLEGETFTVSAIAAAPADVEIAIARFGQPVVDWQNAVGPGLPETISEPVFPGEGTYEVLVREVNGKAAEYALIATYAGDFGAVFKGFLTPGEPVDLVNMDPEETHYWFFEAEKDDLLSFTLTPSSASDLAADLYGPGPQYLEFVDAGIQSEPESLTDYPLTAGGLHAIAVLELDFAEMVYSIEMDLE